MYVFSYFQLFVKSCSPVRDPLCVIREKKDKMQQARISLKENRNVNKRERKQWISVCGWLKIKRGAIRGLCQNESQPDPSLPFSWRLWERRLSCPSSHQNAPRNKKKAHLLAGQDFKDKKKLKKKGNSTFWPGAHCGYHREVLLKDI